jgi:hypothetical protein
MTVGPFARECQISHLMGRVLRHVFEPTSDAKFHAEEASQLERTLMAFMPLLIQEQSTYGMYCAALGMCGKSVTCTLTNVRQLISRSALFLMYDSALATVRTDSTEYHHILDAMESCSARITAFSTHLFADFEDLSLETQSPYIPYSQFQAAVVQYRLWKKTNRALHKDNFDALKKILECINRRWMNAGMTRMISEGFISC